MNYIRTVVCSVCKKTYTEPKHGLGFPGWGSLNGISLDGDDNPMLCPEHLNKVADFVDHMKQGNKNGLD